QGNRFGSASHEIIVRDRIVMQESFPRFVAPNDLVEGFVSVFNNLGRTADIDVTLDLDGPAGLISDSVVTLRLPADGEGNATFCLHADLVPGVIRCRLAATSGNDTARTSFELPNRPAQPLKTMSGSGVVTAQEPATFTLPGGWVNGTDRYIVRTSSLVAVRFARDIQYLLRYPYGCLEQTTSRLFPLLYFNDLAKIVQPELFGGGGPSYFIQEGIARLRSMEFADGSFAFWRGGSRRHHWSTVYASHFLVEARKAGYHVEDDFYQRVLNNVTNIARGRSRDVSDKEHRIYAAFVLAKAGQLTNTIVNYLKDVYADDLPAAARFQMAGALALAGETDYAATLIPADVQPDLFEPETGGTFRSGVRSTAILLDVMLAIAPDHPSVPVLAQSLMESLGERRWYTTQSTSFALMALGAFFKDRAAPDFIGTLRIAGDSAYAIDTASFMLTKQDCADREVTISIDGAGPCFYYWQASGVSVAHAAEEFDRGIKVRRTYLDENGDALDTDSIRLGCRVIGVITAEAENKPLDNVVINDLIPAGFEIENPRIKTSPALSWIPQQAQPIDHQDIRDDRLLIFTDLRPGRPLRYFYSLRAVSAGEFVVPPVAAECMYNPVIAGAASSGRMVIKGAAEH
ncbi:MAG TPA: hypothetical protein VM118_00425, partial [Acidobacteriota bacterium]|nr:hypothetical protein [Acidobacteriota bacterium]